MSSISKERLEFINLFGNKAVIRFEKEKVLPSLVVCQAILESGWGTTMLAVSANNFHGIKWYNDSICRPYSAINYMTKEEYEVGNVVDIEAAFCKFNSVDEELDCYYAWINRNKPAYKKIHGCLDPYENFSLVKEAGYATDSGYVSKLERIYKQYIEYIKPFDDKCIKICSENSKYTVQLGAYCNVSNANNKASSVAGSFIIKVGNYYKVFVGIGSKAEMTVLKNTVHKSGFVTELPEDTYNTELKVGDVVILDRDATVYGTSRRFQSWVYNMKLYVRKIEGNRVVVSIYKEGAVTGAVDIKYILR